MKQLSLKDIAKIAGVAPSTVSFVINKKDREMRISKELSDKIKKILKETGYSPNKTAASLRTGRTYIFGLIIEDISNPFFAQLAKAVEDEAYKIGYSVVYCSTENNDKKGNELVELLSNQVDGFIITPTLGMAHKLKSLKKNNKPFIQVDRFVPGVDAPYIMVDNYTGMKNGVEYLIDAGNSKILFITVDLDQVQMFQREKGYTHALKLHNILSKGRILKIPYLSSAEEYVNHIRFFLKNNPDTDAVVFATNYLGIYGLQALKELSLTIKKDIRVLCFDDHDLFKLYTPSISVINQPVEEIASAAIELLSNQIKKVKNSNLPTAILVMPEFILRNSL